MNYDKLLLDELRFVTFEPDTAELTADRLVCAVTLNEDLQGLGYTLTPADLTSLARSRSLEGFYRKVSSLMDAVPAAPMYPGFPQQVMALSEAEFRFHQLLHYFSTYGLEQLSGCSVPKGWLPEPGAPECRPGKQDRILSAKVIRLLPEKEQYTAPLAAILTRRERMTLPEKELLAQAAAHISPDDIAGLQVGFKENLGTVFTVLFGLADRDAARLMLRSLCRHTGDVLRCVKVLLEQKHYHLRTSEKRFLVKLLESYPVQDLRANLVLSGKSARQNITLLQYLDYSVYAHSQPHLDAVNALRDGSLRSWESQVQTLLRTGSSGALDFIAARPGMLLRMAAWLLRLGYAPADIGSRLLEKADSLSIQTLVTLLTLFGRLTEEDRADAPVLYALFETVLKARLGLSDTVLRGRKVRLCLEDYDLSRSELRCSNKSAEGGFLPAGIAYRIPDGIDALRFFVYWNDEVRVDVDLHAGFTDLTGEHHSVGWNQDFRSRGVVFSGDITHSDAAEYIDIDLTAPIDRVNANIHLFSGREDFASVDTCYVGMMAVPAEQYDEENTALYEGSNCFFRHTLRQKCSTLCYGYVDVPHRCLVFEGVPGGRDTGWYDSCRSNATVFSLARYLELLLAAQGAVLCESDEEAELLLVMGKAGSGREVSLTDCNFFMDMQ